MQGKRILALFFCCVLVVSASGCFASFNLTGKVYDWNKDVSENKWMQELTFLGLSMFPVYGFCMFADAIVVNSIEFWTGNNPVHRGGGDHEGHADDDGDDHDDDDHDG